MQQRNLIYRSELLAYSETFIVAQAAAMKRYTPIFTGLRRLQPSLSLPAPSFPLTEGRRLRDRAQRYLYQKMGYAPALVRNLREQSPALLHAHFALDAAEALPLARALRLPLVVTLHGYDVMTHDVGHAKTRRGRLYLRRREQLFCDASLFLCVSEAIRQKALERGFPHEKLCVHAIGIDVAQYAPAAELPESPQVLFVGRLIEKKGCVHLIRAMAAVQTALPAARLLVIGDGPRRAELQAEARLCAPGTLFLGVQSPTQVKEWMAASRVLAVPSIVARDGDAEGLPTVVGEALATGLPVVGFRSSGIPELVRDGVDGLLVEEGDEAGLARSLVRICADDALADALRHAGRKRVEQSFSLQTQTALLEAIYGEVLAAWAQSSAVSNSEELAPEQANGPNQRRPGELSRSLRQLAPASVANLLARQAHPSAGRARAKASSGPGGSTP